MGYAVFAINFTATNFFAINFYCFRYQFLLFLLSIFTFFAINFYFFCYQFLLFLLSIFSLSLFTFFAINFSAINFYFFCYQFIPKSQFIKKSQNAYKNPCSWAIDLKFGTMLESVFGTEPRARVLLQNRTRTRFWEPEPNPKNPGSLGSK